MKKQKWIKEQLAFDQSSQDSDNELYELLFTQLEKEKEISIKPEFSTQILTKLKKKHKKEAQKDNVLFSFAIISVIFFSFLTIKVMTSLSENASFIPLKALLPALGLAGLIITFQLIDNSLLKKRRIKRHLGV